MAELLDKVPVLKQWSVRYDGIFEMPAFIQGEMVNTFGSYEEGDNIVIDDIVCLDLKSNIVTTELGEVFLLAGNGTRVILSEHTTPDKNMIWEMNKDLIPQYSEDEDDD